VNENVDQITMDKSSITSTGIAGAHHWRAHEHQEATEWGRHDAFPARSVSWTPASHARWSNRLVPGHAPATSRGSGV